MYCGGWGRSGWPIAVVPEDFADAIVYVLSLIGERVPGDIRGEEGLVIGSRSSVGPAVLCFFLDAVFYS